MQNISGKQVGEEMTTICDCVTVKCAGCFRDRDAFVSFVCKHIRLSCALKQITHIDTYSYVTALFELSDKVNRAI